VRVFVVYRPLKNDLNAIVYLKLLIDCITEHSSNSKHIHLIVANLNAPNINRLLLCNGTDRISDILLQAAVKLGFSRLVQFPTRGFNILDVLFTDVDTLITNVLPHPPIGFSDHNGIVFTIDVKFYDSKCDTVIWFVNTTGIVLISSPCPIICCTSIVLYENPSAIDGWNVFIGVLWETINIYVPSPELVSVGKQSRSLPRMIRRYESKRRQTWKQLMKSHHDSLLRSKYRNCTHVWKNLARDNEVANEKRIIEANNLGAFYIYVNKRITNRSNVGVIVYEHGVPVTGELEKTNILIVTLR